MYRWKCVLCVLGNAHNHWLVWEARRFVEFEFEEFCPSERDYYRSYYTVMLRSGMEPQNFRVGRVGVIYREHINQFALIIANST